MIKIGSAMMEYAEQLERERGIPKELILDSLKEAMLAAYKRYAKLPDTEGLLCRLLERSGEIGIYERKWVVETLIEPPEPELDENEEASDEEAVATPAHDMNPDFELVSENAELISAAFEKAARARAVAEAKAEGRELEELALPEVEEEADQEPAVPELRYQILLKEARKIKADVLLGDWLEIEVTPSEFGRIAAQSAKQVITQRIREAEKFLIQKEFDEKRHSVVPAIVQRLEGSNVIVSIGRSDAILPRREQLPGEYYRVGNKLRVFVLDLKDSGRVPQIIVSQGHPQMVREVFELEVPEIEDGLVEIKSIAREAGQRTKVAVHSPDNQVDPQGACIGTRGSRIQAIVNELKNEKIDIIRWAEHPAEFIVNALAPARILEVRLDDSDDRRRALVIVPDDQLSLAIGREGQNVRLAAKLTGFKLDIKSVTQFEQLREALMKRKRQIEQAQLEADAETVVDDDEVLAAVMEASEEAESSAEAKAEAAHVEAEEAESAL
jgi:transcription termination/antitermination protein NusA